MLMPDCKHAIIFSFFQTRKDFFFEKKKQKHLLLAANGLFYSGNTGSS